MDKEDELGADFLGIKKAQKAMEQTKRQLAPIEKALGQTTELTRKFSRLFGVTHGNRQADQFIRVNHPNK